MNLISLPVLPLRAYQAKIWDEIKEKIIKKIILIWHRRAGKDLFCLQFLISEAYPIVGNYWYILPQQNQVRRSIWEGVTKDGMRYLDFIPKELIYKKLDNDMKVVLRHPLKPSEPGSIISFIGGDNYDALAGAGLKGCVISELALQKPSLFDLIIEPILRETNGWVIFNTTPRGENHAKAMYDFLKNHPKYLASLLTIEDTGVVKPEDLDEERQRGKAEEIIQQEYYCSFEGAIHGSYYGDLLKRYEKQNGLFPYDAQYPVHTCWDLGIGDSTAIWFVQFIDKTIRLIDYYENSGFGWGHYAQIVKDKGYFYAGHWLPHDGAKREGGSAERALSIKTQVQNLGLTNVQLVDRTANVYGDIQAVRGILSRCYFNELATKDGHDALKQYRKEWDEDRQKFKDTPYHDWTSHGADAFRMIPYVEKKALPLGIKAKAVRCAIKMR